MPTFRHSPNDLLAALPPKDFALIGAYLRPLDLLFGQVLIEAGAPLRLVYFPHHGIISSMVSLGQGEIIEVAMIGRDGVYGGAAALFGEVSSTAAIIRYPGRASVIDVGHFRAVAERSPALRAALMQDQCIQTLQAEQTVACNATHGVESRLCRRLLQSRQLSGSDRLPLTQDAMAQMLAVQRNTISLVAHALQQAGLIRYSRGHLEITNLDGLARRSCECYAADQLRHDKISVSRGDPHPRLWMRGDAPGLDQRNPS